MMVVGTAGYVVLGLSLLDAVYQTVTTVSTVGFREVGEVDAAFKVFTILLILTGAGTVLYTLSVLLETLIEGRLTDHLWRRRMEREIAGLQGHVIVCGWGRLGRTITADLLRAGQSVVVVDRDPRVESSPAPFVVGDATDDAVLDAAGIDRASTLIAALDTDADNLYVILSARSHRPELFLIARAKLETAEPKLRQAGANRVVNPQLLGGARIAAMTLQPNVSEFLDVVMHEAELEFRLAEVEIAATSVLAGHSLRETHLRDRTGAMVLAIREASGAFLTNPDPDTRVGVGQVLIAIGTTAQLDALRAEAGEP
ncbi:MAG TPA: potassium channel protein [Acidimicrobiales bacterium]